MTVETNLREDSPLLGWRRPLAGLSRKERRRARRGQLFGLPDRAYEQPIYRGRQIGGAYVLVSDPAGVRRVLVENVVNYPKSPLEQSFFTALFGFGLLGSDGELWRRHRRIMAPAFDPRGVASYGPAITEEVVAFLAGWHALPPGATIDMARAMTELTLSIIARTVFSTEGAALAPLVDTSMRQGLEETSRINVIDLIPVVGAWRMRRRKVRLTRGSVALDAAIARAVESRAATLDEAPNDLLTRLVRAKDQDSGATMNGQEIRDEVVTIFMAGHETTAVTMSWAWYVLSQRPGAAARLHAELDAVLGGRPAEQDDLAKLVFTRRVVEEVLRLYPAAPGLSARRAVSDDVVAGEAIRAGTTISISPWVLHRHRDLWDEPERFDPDRFAPDASAGRHRFAYLPFGGGPRVCIGQLLALNEAVLILATLAQRFTPRLAPDARVAMVANITLQPKHGLKMILQRRQAGRGER